MKKRIHLIFFIMFFIILMGVTIYSNFVREQNVFDQMYFTRVHKTFDWWSPGNFHGLFANMVQLEGISRDEESASTEYGYFYERYKADYLEDGAELKISFITDTEELIICYRTNSEDYENSKWYSYDYKVRDKTLTYTTTDSENAKKSFLYEIFLKDWFESNHSLRYSFDYLGNVKIVER